LLFGRIDCGEQYIVAICMTIGGGNVTFVVHR
jgi:hypothetical protein